MNKKVYRVGAGADRGIKNNASTENDPDEKNITPVGGFPHYGEVNHDFLMIRGGIVGTTKRAITLRKSLFPQTRNFSLMKMDIKFIDTSSKIGHGKY